MSRLFTGWMHSGYPIGAYESYATRMINVDKIRRGEMWGEYHELGHNCQHESYSIGQLGEVTCNVFAFYLVKKVSLRINSDSATSVISFTTSCTALRALVANKRRPTKSFQSF